jgi:hypothetical protein
MTGRWLSPVAANYKTEYYDINGILLNVVLSSINLIIPPLLNYTVTLAMMDVKGSG